MIQEYVTERGRREGGRLAAQGVYPIHSDYPDRWTNQRILSIEEDEHGLTLDLEPVLDGPRSLRMIHDPSRWDGAL